MFQPEIPHLIRGRPDERNTVGRAVLRERRVLTQETVTGMDSLGTGRASGIEKLVLPQIAVGGSGATQSDGFVRELHVFRIAVDVGIHRDRADSHAPKS